MKSDFGVSGSHLLSGERQVAKTLDGIRADHRARYEWAHSEIPLGGRVLDLGCGTGYGSKILSQAGRQVVGVDNSHEAIDFAREHYAGDLISYIVGRLPAALGQLHTAFDAIVAFEIVEHLDDPLGTLRECRRLLRPSGKVLISVPNEEAFPFSPERAPFHKRHYTVEQMLDLVKAAGFDEVAIFGQLTLESAVNTAVNREMLRSARTLVAVALGGTAAAEKPKTLADIAAAVTGAPVSVKSIADIAIPPEDRDDKPLGGRLAFDGDRLAATEWPRLAVVADEYLKLWPAAGIVVERKGRELHLTPANGWAVYTITDEDGDNLVVQLIQGEVTPTLEAEVGRQAKSLASIFGDSRDNPSDSAASRQKPTGLDKLREANAAITRQELDTMAERLAELSKHVGDLRNPPATAMRAADGAALDPIHGKHVAILALGPSLDQYVDRVKKLGSRHELSDEVWAINAVADTLLHDRVFHMDDVLIQEMRSKYRQEQIAKLPPEKALADNIGPMLTWLKKHPGPVYTSIVRDGYPGMVAFPIEAVINGTGYNYFNSTVAYAVAYAIYAGAKRISLFGCDFAYPSAHKAEKGRACVEFWIAVALDRGIEVAVAETSTLMDTSESIESHPYGYDAVDVKLSRTPSGGMRVDMWPRAKLPLPEEIELAYDHGVHPNALVRAGIRPKG